MKRFFYLVLCLAAALLLLPVLSASANDIAVTITPAVGGTVTGTGTYETGATAVMTAAPNAGFRFIGWFEDDVLVTADLSYPFMVFSGRTLVAQFGALGPFTVTLDPNGGALGLTELTKLLGEPLTLPVPTRTGNWRFLGWHDSRLADGAAVSPMILRRDNVYTADDDITLYASWEPGTGTSLIPAWQILLLAVLGVFMIIFGGTMLRKKRR
jgi:hypothetical protein